MNLLKWYFGTYKGLSREIWIMAATLLINRSGLMVMTFLTIYLTNKFGYSIEEAGFAVGFYGVGSIVGVWLGGQLADVIGYLRIQILALITSGCIFISMYFAHEYWHFILLSFLVSATADMFRPANMASIPWYSTPENQKRSIALVRLAINLGISIGPALGGFLAISYGYESLFFVDGFTCIGAGIFMFCLLGAKDPEINDLGQAVPKNGQEDSEPMVSENTEDIGRFWRLLGSIFIWSFVFFQLIYTFPLFMEKELGFDEFTIGLFFTLNGLIIFVTEMPIVQRLQDNNVFPILNVGILICALSFIFLFFGVPGALIFPIGYILLITFGEIFYLPFTNSLALDFTPLKKKAKYMAYYALAFSVSHITSPVLGTYFAENYSFQHLWAICFVLMLFVLVLTATFKK